MHYQIAAYLIGLGITLWLISLYLSSKSAYADEAELHFRLLQPHETVEGDDLIMVQEGDFEVDYTTVGRWSGPDEYGNKTCKEYLEHEGLVNMAKHCNYEYKIYRLKD